MASKSYFIPLHLGIFIIIVFFFNFFLGGGGANRFELGRTERLNDEPQSVQDKGMMTPLYLLTDKNSFMIGCSFDKLFLRLNKLWKRGLCQHGEHIQVQIGQINASRGVSLPCMRGKSYELHSRKGSWLVLVGCIEDLRRCSGISAISRLGSGR